MQYKESPDWLKAVDSHSVAESGNSMFEDVVSGISDVVGGVAESVSNAPAAVVVSAVSGLNSLYNSGVHVANWLPSVDVEYADTGEILAAFDNDLSEYYKSDEGFFDTVGFIGTSFIPGGLAIKGLKAAQKSAAAASAGNIGSNLSRATGLLVPKMELSTQIHAAELASRSGVWKLSQVGTLKTIGAGATQGVLEGIAFEAAVATTMFESPIFDDMDAADMVANMSIGVVFGGAVGAIAGAAQSYSKVNKLLRLGANQREVDTALSNTTVLNKATNHSDFVVAAAADIEELATPITAERILSQKINAGESGYSISQEAVEAEVAHLNRVRDTSIKNLRATMRTSIRNLHQGKNAGKLEKGTGLKESLGNQVADLVENAPTQIVDNVFDRMKFYTRVSEQSDFSAKVGKIAKEQGITRKEAEALAGPDTTAYLQLHSGGIGKVLDAAPGTAVRLADRFTPAGILKFVGKNETASAKTVAFNTLRTAADAEARWIKYSRGNVKLSTKVAYSSLDLPVIKKAMESTEVKVLLAMPEGDVRLFTDRTELAQLYQEAQRKTVTDLVEAGVDSHTIEAITDVRVDFIEGSSKLKATDPMNYRAQESYAADLNKQLGRTEDKAITVADLHMMPKFIKASYLDDVVDSNGMVLKGMQQIEYSNKLLQEAVDRVTVNYMGEKAQGFVNFTPSMLRKVWKGGTGQGGITNAGGQYGSTERVVSHNANIYAAIKKEKLTALKENLEYEVNLLLGDSKTAIQWSALNETVANQSERFVLAKEGDRLIPKKLDDYLRLADEGIEGAVYPTLDPGTPLEIPFASDSIRDIAIKHLRLNDEANSSMNAVHAVQGNYSERVMGIFRPVRQDPRQYKHHLIVKDRSVTGVGHTKMILARSGEELELLKGKVDVKQYEILSKTDTDEYFKSLDSWLYDKTLHENYLDVELRSKGIRSSYFPMTDPQLIADTFLQHHIRNETAVLEEHMATKFAGFIDQMEKRGRVYAGDLASSTDHISKLAVSTKNNPFMAQVKSLFNQSRLEDAPDWWLTTQAALDRAVSTTYNKVDRIMQQAFRGGDLAKAAREANEVFESVGLRTSYYDTSLQLMANSKIDRGVLSTFIREANTFLTGTLLRTDVFNAVSNKLGNSILMSSELQSLLNGIKAGDETVAGELAKLAYIKIPGTSGDLMLAPSKLIAESYSDIFKAGASIMDGTANPAFIKEFKDRGLLPDFTDQIFQAMDAVTLTGATKAVDLKKKTAQMHKVWNSFIEKGSKITGNELSEQLNRLVAGVAAKKITDLAVKAGVLTAEEAWPYISTFVARVNGAVRAAERPLMFQGPIGQAMGLFQSYQFNLMQQVFRHLGEGRTKSLAYMAGMQTSVYGATSLPGFDLINQHLIGQASGNDTHADLYTASYNVFGSEGAEWLLYGAPSNLLNASLYTRGNTNPRVWHVVPNPTNPKDIPFISAFAKAFGSIKQAFNSTAEGAPVWASFVSAIEHSGLSRPLAGIAAVSRGVTGDSVYTTQLSGNFLYENDLLSLASLARVAGAKPIDEAIMQNNYYRKLSYLSADLKDRNQLGVAIRTAIASGNDPTQEQINDYALEYVKRGGSQKRFNSYFMSQYRNATVSQAEQLSLRLGDPSVQKVQAIMGGTDSLE